jgi:hypothetical protein
VLLVCTVCSVLYSEIAVSQKLIGILERICLPIHILLRIVDTMTSQNTELPSCGTLYTGLQKDVARWKATRNISNNTATEIRGER